MDKASNPSSSKDTLTALVESESFSNLEPDIQKKIIDTVHADKDRNGGFMGKLFGTKPTNLAIHTAFILCIVLILLVILDNLHAYFAGKSINMDLIGIIIPVVSLSIGYIFGKGSD